MNAFSFLKGKTVLITRTEKESAGFVNQLSEVGASPIVVPLVGFEERDLDEKEKRLLTDSINYDWLVFTSKNGVDFFFMKDLPFGMLPKLASIGEKTTERMTEWGYTADFEPTKYVAETFIEEFLAVLPNQSNILVLKGNLARKLIPETLRENGHRCDELILYENVLPPSSGLQIKKLIERSQLDVLTFASSSAVDHFIEIIDSYNLREAITDCVVACIGPVAAKTAEQHGLTVHVRGEPFTMDGMLKQLVEYDGLHKGQGDYDK
ncbi:MAG: uroporphyrinogen-III synthase [Bacillus sp. (in: firmicutes)]